MFDQTKEFEISIISGGRKTCVCRFPSDEEWAERARKQKIVRRMLGRGKSEMDSPSGTVPDEALFAKIRIDKDGPEFDGADAARVLAKLERSDVLAIERSGDRFAITLKVPGATTTHTVGIPYQKDVMEHSAASMGIVSDRRSQEIRVSLEPSGRLYDKVLVRAEGYAGAVPLPHKSTVISELLAAIAAEDEDDPEA